MNNPLKYFVLVSLSLVVGFSVSYLYFKPKIDRSPPWHPFELNSNIDLKSLVEEGYRCFSIPCDQAQFIKTVGDTMIQYDVSSIDCKTYEGRYDPPTYEELEDEELILDTISSMNIDASSKAEAYLTDSANHFSELKIWEERHNENPSFPYDIDEIKDCYQGIHWRIFKISMNNIDSIWIVNYIRKKGGMITEFQNWNSSVGGDFLVYHNDSDLYFRCSISKDEYYTWDSTKNWNFEIVRSIPHLDQQRQELEKQRKEKQFQYYKE